MDLHNVSPALFENYLVENAGLGQLVPRLVEKQHEFNSVLRDDWYTQDWSWESAMITEIGELNGFLPWPWWKAVKVTPAAVAQACLELVDITCFGVSFEIRKVCETNPDIKHAMNRVSNLLVTDAMQIRKVHGVLSSAGKPVPVWQLTAAISAALAQGHFSLSMVLATAQALGYNAEQFYGMYLGKMVLNKFRQDNGYKAGTYRKHWANGPGEEPQEDNVHLARIVREMHGAGSDEKQYTVDLYTQLEASYYTNEV